jgi:hypothetical protein
MTISEKNKQLIERVLETVDWSTILKFYKLVKREIGAETTGIPGIKKLKRGEKISSDHIKEEVKCLVHHVVENDISQFIYGPWNILWVNGEWEIEVEGEEGSEEPMFVPILESVLELSFSPMVVISKETLITDEDPMFMDSDKESLNRQLEKAIDEEKYELAAKLKDLIEMYEKQNGKKSN